MPGAGLAAADFWPVVILPVCGNWAIIILICAGTNSEDCSISGSPMALASETMMFFNLVPIAELGDILTSVCWSKSRAIRAFTFACISSPCFFSGVAIGAAIAAGIFSLPGVCMAVSGDAVALPDRARNMARISGDGILRKIKRMNPAHQGPGRSYFVRATAADS